MIQAACNNESGFMVMILDVLVVVVVVVVWLFVCLFDCLTF